jgi:hypothetical protein
MMMMMMMMMLQSWFAPFRLLLSISLGIFPVMAFGFLGVSTTTTRSSCWSKTTATATATARPTTTSSRLNCICVNCKWVTSCQAYHFVETKHEQPHMTSDPTFEPRDGSPTIQVHIRSIRTEEDRAKEVERMWKEHQAETKKAEEQQQAAEQQAAEAAAAKEEDRGDAQPSSSSSSLPLHLVGETTYDFSPVTTYEYDVVACEDFVPDQGCWVRNMPEEIRLANPEFVPS